MGKRLILVRHADQEMILPMHDNGLSQMGRAQAQKLTRFFTARQEQMQWENDQGLLLSSPKRRCLETLEDLRSTSGALLEVRSELDEQGPTEPFELFEDRILNFLKWFQSEGPLWCVVCSHGDWIPIVSQHICRQQFEVQKGAWIEFEYSRGAYELK